MKKIILVMLVALIQHNIYSQVKINNPSIVLPKKENIVAETLVRNKIKAENKFWVEVFDKPGYTGKAKIYTANTTSPQLPQDLKNISVHISPNTIAFLTINCNDGPGKISVLKDMPNVTINSNSAICSILLDEKMFIEVKYNGLESQIHNNDCKKAWGKVEVSVSAGTTDGDVVPCATEEKLSFTPVLFLNSTAATFMNYQNYIFNTPTTPVETVVFNSTENKFLTQRFIVGKSALQNDKVTVLVKCKFQSAHKSSDLALDYMDNIKTKEINMLSFIPTSLPFYGNRTLGRYVALGPVPAQGVQNTPNRSGYIGRKEFKLHFSVVYPFDEVNR
jgi:hypothetical protein